MRPTELITKLLTLSIAELKYVTAQIQNRKDLEIHRFLLPTYDQGLRNAIAAYRELLTVRQIVVPMNSDIKRLLEEYANEWSFLFDAVRRLDKKLSDAISDARETQKEAHKCLVEILTDGVAIGQNEYDEFTDFLTILSEEMGERAETIANKKSTKGQEYNKFNIKVKEASRKSGIPAITLYRQVKKDAQLRMVLNADRIYPFLYWAIEFLKIHTEIKVKKHEANMMNHAQIVSSLTDAEKAKYGFN